MGFVKDTGIKEDDQNFFLCIGDILFSMWKQSFQKLFLPF